MAITPRGPCVGPKQHETMASFHLSFQIDEHARTIGEQGRQIARLQQDQKNNQENLDRSGARVIRGRLRANLKCLVESTDVGRFHETVNYSSTELHLLFTLTLTLTFTLKVHKGLHELFVGNIPQGLQDAQVNSCNN